MILRPAARGAPSRSTLSPAKELLKRRHARQSMQELFAPGGRDSAREQSLPGFSKLLEPPLVFRAELLFELLSEPLGQRRALAAA